jgi:glyoxylase-like metal-dependent hydrolase (beta-lactamase superfamily II)
VKKIEPAIGSGERDLGDLRVLLAGVPGATDRGWLGYCTVVLFPLEDGWALFDTGHQSDRHILFSALQASDIRPDDIRHVVLSHLHFDHSLNLPLFPNAEIYISRAEIDYAQQVSTGEVRDFSIPDFWPALLDKRRVHIVDGDLRISPTKRLKVLPGHTPGCMAMFCDGPRSIAICGDVIKNAWEAVTGKAMIDEATAGSSMRTVLDEGSVIVPGHDTPFIMGAGDSVEFLIPFCWEVKSNLYPEMPERTVLKLERRAGIVHDRTSVEDIGMKKAITERGGGDGI